MIFYNYNFIIYLKNLFKSYYLKVYISRRNVKELLFSFDEKYVMIFYILFHFSAYFIYIYIFFFMYNDSLILFYI